jgi:DNA topoisomerase-2
MSDLLKYKKLTDIEHVLLRPGMYVGSIKHKTCDVSVYEQDSFVFKSVTYNPAFLKIFDEIVSNSVDEHRRNPKKLTKLDVLVDVTRGAILVKDNGGIVVAKHPEHQEWIPELIFSNLKAGSNFDDSEERLVAGTNGVGSTLTNIFSKVFRVKTCDGKKEFCQKFTNNMTSRDEPDVKPASSKKGFTEIAFIPDFERFEMSGIDEDHMLILQKRVIDLAACNPSLKVTFNNKDYSFDSFEKYCKLYTPEVIYVENPRWKVGISHSNGSMQQVSFVNSVETSDGGTHVDYISNQIVSHVRELIKKKYKIDIRPQEIKNHMFLFVQADIINPIFSSQTKEKLITEPKQFGSSFEFNTQILKKILSSEIVERILDWAQQKSIAEEKKELRALNKNLSKSKILKLIDAKETSKRSECSLAIFEGDSASSAFRKYRDPRTQGAFPLRGKFINVSDLSPLKVVKNKEVTSLLGAVGLKLGEEAKDLRYGKILIYSDADPDGDSIAGLLINFFGRYWPEMFEQEIICRVVTPIVVAKKGKDKLSFYTSEEFSEWVSDKSKIKGWDIEYKKGLAALEDEEYKEIIKSPRMFVLEKGDNFHATLKNWFSKNPIHRKIKILGRELSEEEVNETIDEIVDDN